MKKLTQAKCTSVQYTNRAYAPFGGKAMSAAVTQRVLGHKPIQSRSVFSLALLTTAALLSNPVQAGSCPETAPGSNTYQCANAANPGVDVTQVIANPTSITTTSGFGIDTSTTPGGSAAIQISGTPNLDFAFTDANNSLIKGSDYGLYVALTPVDGGAVSISSNGSVVGDNSYGILAILDGPNNSTSLNVNEASGSYGLGVVHQNRGPIDITTQGDITGTFGKGMLVASGQATRPAPGGGLEDDPDSTITINTQGNVTSDGDAGIAVYSDIGGTTSITTNGNITAASHAIAALIGRNYSAEREVNISVNSPATLTGGPGAATIFSRTSSGNKSIITINPGAHVNSADSNTDTAIEDTDGDATVVVDGGKISGGINLGEGMNSLTFTNGADFDDVTFIFGNRYDTLTFSGTAATPTMGTFSGAPSLPPGNPIFGRIENLIIDNHATVNFDNTLRIFTDFMRIRPGGVLSLQDNEVGDEFTYTGGVFSGDGTFVGSGGTVHLDAVLDDGATPGNSDHFIIDGRNNDDEGITTVRVNNVNGMGGQTTGDGILLITVTAESNGTFVLAPGELRAGDYVYDLVKVGKNWYLQSRFLPASTAAEEIPIFGAWGAALLSSLLGLSGLFFRRRKAANSQ